VLGFFRGVPTPPDGVHLVPSSPSSPSSSVEPPTPPPPPAPPRKKQHAKGAAGGEAAAAPPAKGAAGEREAYVEFATADDCERAMSRDRQHLGGRFIELLRVSRAEMLQALPQLDVIGANGHGHGQAPPGQAPPSPRILRRSEHAESILREMQLRLERAEAAEQDARCRAERAEARELRTSKEDAAERERITSYVSLVERANKEAYDARIAAEARAKEAEAMLNAQLSEAAENGHAAEDHDEGDPAEAAQ